MTRSMKTVPNCTSVRWRFSLPIETCNNMLMSHASATAKISSVCFSYGWFLGMSDVYECLVGFKWLWWLFKSRHLAVNHHTTANWCYSLIWLLCVAFEAQMDHCWGHFRVSITDLCLAHHFVAPHHPQPTTP